jgi:spore germination protein GerM
MTKVSMSETPRGFASGLALMATLLLLSTTPACTKRDDAKAEPPSIRLQVYFNNDRLATDPTDCAAVFPVERKVPKTPGVATAALRELFGGPLPSERAAGYRSFFSAATAGLLESVRVQGNTAYVNLNDLRTELSGATSSCGAAEFHSQVSHTLLQFPTIKRVIYAIDGEPRTFYEWMNESCGSANDNCDALPFKEG